MVERRNGKTFARRIVPRIFKATFLVVITYLPIYFFSALVSPIQPFFPWYEPLTNIFTGVFLFFLVAGVFSSGTVFQYVFSAGRTLALMLFFFFVLNGGIIRLTVPVTETTANIMIDLTIVLAMLILVCLLGIGRNVVQAIDFMARKVETREI